MTGRQTTNITYAGFLAIFFLAFSSDLRGQLTEAFDIDPQWEGFRNRLLPETLPMAKQDFGYRESNLAGGKSAGEIGGSIQRADRRAYFAKAISPKTLQDKLSASGKFAVHSEDGSSGVLFGWFNHKNSHGWRTPSSLAFRIDGNGDKFWVFYEYGTTNRATGGGGAYEGPRYQTTKTPPFAADGATHQWSLDYDPQGADGLGEIVFRIDDREYRLPLHPGHKDLGATFDRFGIWTQQTPGDSLEVYFDDIRIEGVEQSFDEDPQWLEVGNHEEYRMRILRPYHDFGFSNTRYAGGKLGEIGGIVFRDERPAYYANRVGPFSLDDELFAEGKMAFRTAGADSGILLGWFDSAGKQAKQTPEYEQPQADYLGIYLEGPSRVGHYFRAAYSTSQGNRDAPTFEGQAEERPIVQPGGETHQWSLHYEPEAANGRGRITVSFDGKPHQLVLKEGARAESATFDRFGLFDVQAGGHHVEVFFDDLRYSN